MGEGSSDEDARQQDADAAEGTRSLSDATRPMRSGWASDAGPKPGRLPAPPPPPVEPTQAARPIHPAPPSAAVERGQTEQAARPATGWQPSDRAAPAPPAAASGRPMSAGAAPAAQWFWPLFRKSFFVMAILVAVGVALMCALGFAGYVVIASTLPSPEGLAKRATELFTSSQIYDADGRLIYELLDPQGGRRTVVPLEQMSTWVISATIDTEDPRFYEHPGFDPFGIARAVLQNLREGETVSGASTIAQQLVRSLLLPEGADRSVSRKIREIVLAAEVTRQYPRGTILELYLNSSYYGNLAYGVEAAAQTYFAKSARNLTLAEGSFVAGLVQSPAVYDPFTPDGRAAALARHRDVLRLMREAGDITPAQSAAAAAEMEAYDFQPPRVDAYFHAPHFVQYVRQIVEQEFGPQALYRGGLKIFTTLDPRLQSMAETAVRDQIAALADKHVTDGALLAVEAGTGRIVTMVGSPDYNNEAIAGQINMATTPRQTGSAIKPLTYLAAFEKGWTPSTAIWDVPVVYTDTAGNVYQPRNYDGKFHGPQLVRSALANSYNVPAVRTLEFVTVPEFLTVAQRFGITTFTRPDYGLALTLGGGEAPLIEMVGAFQIFANGGVRRPPVAIEQITDALGNVVCRFTPPGQDAGGVPPCEPAAASAGQVISPQHAYLISHILSDNAARCPAFGCPNVLEIGRPAAVKTGTTNDYRDNWTIGYTPDLVAGVWVGNADRSEMKNISGVTGAGPIWHDFMQQAMADRPVLDFARPGGIIEMEVCAVSGTQPSAWCPARRTEIFSANQPPLGPEHDWYQNVRIDIPTGLRWVEGCTAGFIEKVLAVVPPDGVPWAQEHGLEVAPIDTCTAGSGSSVVSLSNPPDGGIVTGVVDIFGSVQMPDFEHYDVMFGDGWEPAEWRWISGPHQTQMINGPLATWDTNGLAEGQYTLRVVVYAQSGGSTDARVRLIVNRGVVPTPTDTPGPTSTPTLEPTETPLFAPTLPPSTPTPEPTLPPTDTVEPSPAP